MRLTWIQALIWMLVMLVAASGCGSSSVVRVTPIPDGGGPDWMAFVAQDNGVNHLHVTRVDASGKGSTSVRLTNSAEAENYPSWSPDGKRLVYARDYDGSAIYVLNVDGSKYARLSPMHGMDVTPSWSPDGTKIIYSHLRSAPQPNKPPLTDIRVMNSDGTGDHAILANVIFAVEPRWSVNDRIVFMSLMHGGMLDIYTMNADGTDLRQLTTSQGNNGDPVWSPDGSLISFGSDREGGDKVNIFAMRADGSEVTQLTHFGPPYEAGDTNWSSDGKKIAFEYDISGKKQSDPNAIAEVWTMNADGSDQHSTGARCSGVGCAPRWQPGS